MAQGGARHVHMAPAPAMVDSSPVEDAALATLAPWPEGGGPTSTFKVPGVLQVRDWAVQMRMVQ